jgi:hypothetical protein
VNNNGMEVQSWCDVMEKKEIDNKAEKKDVR